MPRMPALPSRSNAFTPPPSSGQTGIMPDLYRLSVGPVNADYYQQQFNRFEALGKVIPTWNHGAAFFTLTWLLMRKLWRPAGIYAGLLGALLLLWWLGLHGRVPLQLEVTVCLLTILLLCAVPGFMGNGLYYQHVRNQTLKTLTRASSIGQARAQLAQQAITKERFQLATAIQVLAMLAVAAVLYYALDAAPQRPANDAPSGPPDLVIPSASPLPPLEPVAFTPDQPLPQPALPEPITPAIEAAPAQDSAASSTLALAPSVPVTAQPSTAASPPAPAAVSAAAITPAPVAATPEPVAPSPAKKLAAPPPAAKPQPKPAAKPTPKPAPPPAASGQLIAGKYYLNAGVYAQTANVDKAVKSLQAAKLNAVRQTVSSNKGELTRLRIGPFDTRQQAEQAAIKAKRLRIDSSVFQQPKK